MAATNLNPDSYSSPFYVNIDAGTSVPFNCAASGPTAGNLTCARRFICTTAGTLQVKRPDGTSISIVMLAGQTYDIQIGEVTARGTTIGLLCW